MGQIEGVELAVVVWAGWRAPLPKSGSEGMVWNPATITLDRVKESAARP